jgi:aquaporin Z
MELIKYFVELIGTFIFVSIILNTLTDSSITPVSVAVGLLAVIYFGGRISGGHFNPAVSIAMFLKNKITMQVLLGYIVVQILGAGVAVKFNNYTLSKLYN